MEQVLRGLVLYMQDDDIAAGIMGKALVARGCNWVDMRLGLKKRDEPNVRWGRYKYIFVSPDYYEMFKGILRKLEETDHFVAICSMSKAEFRRLKKEHGSQKNGASKVMYICTALFSLCGDIHEK